jgi:5-methylcytosine-specific restriction endonuclease McrA
LNKERGPNFKDITGNKYGMLTVEKLFCIDNRGTSWVLRCDCGKRVVRISSNFKKKQHRHSCGCVPTNPGKKDAGLRRLFNDYRASAIRRGHSFNLNMKQFKALVFNNCFYCGGAPTSRYEKQVVHILFANGIDRLDNNKNYTLKNCVSCCKICNRAKGTLSVGDFYKWISNFDSFQRGKNA